MKTRFLTFSMLILSTLMGLTSCSKDDNQGEIIYSDWFSPTAWSGTMGNWYFYWNEKAITQDVLDNGAVLAYVKITNDEIPERALPASLGGANWSFLISDIGELLFSTDMNYGNPSTSNEFRYIIIKGGKHLKFAGSNGFSIEKLKTMSYTDVCRALGIPQQ
jgi:hypothetical protein